MSCSPGLRMWTFVQIHCWSALVPGAYNYLITAQHAWAFLISREGQRYGSTYNQNQTQRTIRMCSKIHGMVSGLVAHPTKIKTKTKYLLSAHTAAWWLSHQNQNQNLLHYYRPHLNDYLGVHHPLGIVKLDFHHPRKTERKKETQKRCPLSN